MLKYYFKLILMLVSTLFFIFSTESQALENTNLLEQRIYMLEKALAPEKPQAVAELWAEAAKNRNGAVTYMLMCPALQKKYLSNLVSLNWVTGVSSPWIADYKITKNIANKNNKIFQYIINYQFNLSGKNKNKITGNDYLTVMPVINQDQNISSQKWCVSEFKYLSPVDSLN